ncbi:LOW QUALITY PROTEIN: uncharacterized protein crebzf [Neosynchiropus ocellatus]
MMTRRQARNLEPLEVEVVDVLSTVDLPSPTEDFPEDVVDNSGIELDDLFGLEDFSFSWDQDSKSPFYELSNVEAITAKDSAVESFTGPCSPREPSTLKVRERQSKLSRGINKNAIAARLNRLRKKEYVNSLEKKVGLVASENNMLKRQNSELTKRVEELEDETRYLRAVLANESVLAQLLSRLSGVNGMKLSSSLFQGHNSNDHDYALQRKRVKVEEKETSGGVCLHVDKNHVSVEFCTKCAESASTSLKIVQLILLVKVKRLDKLLPTWPDIFVKVVSVINGTCDFCFFFSSIAAHTGLFLRPYSCSIHLSNAKSLLSSSLTVLLFLVNLGKGW